MGSVDSALCFDLRLFYSVQNTGNNDATLVSTIVELIYGLGNRCSISGFHGEVLTVEIVVGRNYTLCKLAEHETVPISCTMLNIIQVDA